MNVSEINKIFSIEGVLQVSEKHIDFPFLEIKNKHAVAIISLYGGQVLSYKKTGSSELLFLSEKAFYQKGKAIKGGIPVCWPWFGNDPEDKGRPAHGFARNTLWELESTEQLDNGSTKVVMSLQADDDNKKIFTEDFKLTLAVTIGLKLELELTTKNNGQRAFNITQAMHTYFSVNNIDEVSISGLDGAAYLDKAKSNAGEENKMQVGDIVFNGEVDRIYLDAPNALQINQKEVTNPISIQSKNNKTAVVWNPWKKLCEQSVDLKTDDYKRFVCVETANAADDVIEILPGESFSLCANYSGE